MIPVNCKNANLLNHLKQRGIPVSLEQKLYRGKKNHPELSWESKEVETIPEEKLRIPYYEYVLVLDKLLLNQDDTHRINNSMWVSTFKINDKSFSMLGRSKAESLNLVMTQADSYIRQNF